MPHRELLTESQRLSLHAPASDERGMVRHYMLSSEDLSADQSSPRRSHGKLRVLPVILPGGERAKESDLPGFLQGTWVEFHRSLDDEEALHRLACGIQGILPGRQPGVSIPEGECPYLGLKL